MTEEDVTRMNEANYILGLESGDTAIDSS
jgi:hypothetical protein